MKTTNNLNFNDDNMLQTQPITKTMTDFKLIEKLYRNAFPKQERIPMGSLLSRAKHKDIHFDTYYDGDTVVGLSYIITHKDITYLFYLATGSKIRSKGYGKQILSHIKANYYNQRLVLNCLAEDTQADDNDLRLRRQNFYLRNGYTHTGFSCDLSGNHVIVFVQNGTITTKEFSAIFKKFWGPIMFMFFKPKMRD